MCPPFAAMYVNVCWSMRIAFNGRHMVKHSVKASGLTVWCFLIVDKQVTIAS